MNKKIKIFISVFFLCLFLVLFYFIYKVFNADTAEPETATYSYGYGHNASEMSQSNYLPYCSGIKSSDWINYPFFNSGSYDCLPKRYCSDLICREFAIGEFQRTTVKDSNENYSCLIKFTDVVVENSSDCTGITDISHPIDNQHDNSNPYGYGDETDVNNLDLTGYTAYCYGIKTETSGNNLSRCLWKFVKMNQDGVTCTLITRIPKILSIAQKPQLYYPKANGVGIDGDSITDISKRSCFYKSCRDLTTDEFKAIYSETWGGYTKKESKELSEYCSEHGSDPQCSDLSSDQYPVFYKFCNPYFYDKAVTMNGQVVKYASSNSSEHKSVYCHQLKYSSDTGGNFLEYIIKYGDAYNKDNNVSYSNSGNDIYYQCILHQCPLGNIYSKTCESNYYLFFNRSANYITNYEKYILGNTGYCASGASNASDCVANTESTKENNCSAVACSTYQYPVMVNCTNESTLNSKCDTYKDIDPNLLTSNSNLSDLQLFSELKNEMISEGKTSEDANQKIKDNLKITSCTAYLESPNINGTSKNTYLCTKSFDCSLKNSENLSSDEKDGYSKVCNVDSNQDDDKAVLSPFAYYYRPVPPSSATEILKGSEDTRLRRWLYGKAEDDKEGSHTCDYLWSSTVGGPNGGEDHKIDSGNNYFNFDDNCIGGSSGDFKEYGEFEMYVTSFKYLINNDCSFDTYDMGYYYNGFWRTTQASMLPHIIRLCDPTFGTNDKSLGGREYMCGNSGNICNTPYWDSYYIGNDFYNYDSNNNLNYNDENSAYIVRNSVTGEVDKIIVKVFIRLKNSLEFGVCGKRECRVDCAFGLCESQYCGDDERATLTLTRNSNGVFESDSKEVTDSVLSGSAVYFRAIVKNNRVYVFVDETSEGCNSDTGNIDNSKKSNSNYLFNSNLFSNLNDYDPYNKPGLGKNSIGGGYSGRIKNGEELFDDNSLSDNDCDGEITNNDVFGENLYSVLNCDSTLGNIDDVGDWCYNGDDTNIKCKKNGYRSSKCDYLAIGDDNIKNAGGDIGTVLGSKKVTIDIVQYIGNNQIFKKNSDDKYVDNIEVVTSPSTLYRHPVLDKCLTKNGLGNCRGVYLNLSGSDNYDGQVFMDEQQGIKIPLSMGPALFYKYATFENSSNLFLPILELYSFQSNFGGAYIPLTSSNVNSALLNYFEPSIQINFNNTYLRESIPIESLLKTGSISSVFSGKNTDVYYYFKKESNLSGMIPYVCLYQKTSCSKLESESNCNGDYLKDQKVCCSGVDKKIQCLNRAFPSISIFFIKPLLSENKPTVNAYFNKNNKKLNFFTDINDQGSVNLLGDSYVFSQNYPIYLTSSTCSKLNYECISYKKLLLTAENAGVSDSAYLTNLKNIVSVCEGQIETTCNELNGNEVNVLLKLSNDKSGIVKIKEDNNSNGASSDVCVTKGFSSYEEYVKSLQSTDKYIGKCILDSESKKKKFCRVSDNYYEFCSGDSSGKSYDNGTYDSCKCLDGTKTCDCNIEDNCYKVINCSCNNDISCLSLPEECFKPGFNKYGGSLTSDGSVQDSCKCIGNNDSIPSSYTNSKLKASTIEVRKATPRELGLCADLRQVDFCSAIKYYGKDKIYYQSGAGLPIGQVGVSNIWRTSQRMYGTYYLGDLGHAEFDKTTNCDVGGKNDLTGFGICLLTQYSGTEYADINGKADFYYEKGNCKGFWKNSLNVNPMATCTFNSDGISEFNLIPGTGCVRYSCPVISDENSAVLLSENNNYLNTENSAKTFDRRGLYNGYATWEEYKKGTDFDVNEKYKTDGNVKYYSESDFTKVDTYTNGNGTEAYKTKGEAGWENGHGDDLELRQAQRCLNGYAPVGFNNYLKEYMPAITSTANLIDGNISWSNIEYNLLATAQDKIIKAMVGYDLTKANIRNDTGGYVLSDYNEYSNVMNYHALDHLPVRYCNQVGEWTTVSDIYSKFKVDGYYKDNIKLKNIQNSTSIDDYYKDKYCERLTCQSININDIGLLSTEEIKPTLDTNGNILNCGENNKKYSNNTSVLNSTIVNNDNCYYSNPAYNNKYTYWRHAGGATWPETVAPRFSSSSNFNLSVDKVGASNNNSPITGNCATSRNFYPHNVQFLDTFDAQFANIINKKISDTTNWTVSLKDYDKELRKLTNDEQPYRYCGKWGLWSPIQNKCASACEAIDPFKTTFSDLNSDYKLENYEITEISRTSSLNNYSGSYSNFGYINSEGANNFHSTNPTTGYDFTGGAKWPRAKSGESVYGTCDSSVGVNCASSNYSNSAACNTPDGTGYVANFPNEGAQFLQNGTKPYRTCLADGTWGPIVNPCLHFVTCTQQAVRNYDLFDIINGEKAGNFDTTIQVATLEGGDISYSDAKAAMESNSNNYFDINANCNSNIAFESGTITRSCNIIDGSWKDNLTNTCIPRTCGNLSYILGDISNPQDLASIVAGTYYVKNTGYIGEITINGKKYSNYSKGNIYCPSGYTYESASNLMCYPYEIGESSYSQSNIADCDNAVATKYKTNSADGIKFTCAIDLESNSGTKTYGKRMWVQQGSCKPITCSWNKLPWVGRHVSTQVPGFSENIYIVKNGSNFTGKIYNPVSSGNSSLVPFNDTGSDVLFTVGTQINMTAGASQCETGYMLTGGNIVAKCSLNNGGTSADWTYSGGSCIQVCSKDEIYRMISVTSDTSVKHSPGSVFYFSYTKFGLYGTSYKSNGDIAITTTGVDYNTDKTNSIYFSNGSFIEAECANDNYIETGDKINGADYSGTEKVLVGNQSTRHHYYCENGHWKIVGGCYKPCQSMWVNYREGCTGKTYRTSSSCPLIYNACVSHISNTYNATSSGGDYDSDTNCSGETNRFSACGVANDYDGVDGIETICSTADKYLPFTKHGTTQSISVIFRPIVRCYTDRRFRADLYYYCNNGTYGFSYSNVVRGENNDTCSGDKLWD